MNEERLDHRFSHEWHVAINQFHDGKIWSPDWRRWMYEAKTMADEVPRMAMLFKRERDGLLKCGCVAREAAACLSVRYQTDPFASDLYQEECYCPCHDEDEEDDDE